MRVIFFLKEFKIKSKFTKCKKKKKKGPLKRDCLDIYLTMPFGLRKFINTSAMRVIHFLKIFKIQCKFTKWKKNLKLCFVSEIIASENVTIKSLY